MLFPGSGETLSAHCGGVNKQIHAERLVTGGMFAPCRNPLYGTAYFWLAGGASLLLIKRVRPVDAGCSAHDLAPVLSFLVVVTLVFFVVWRLKRMRFFAPRNA